MLMTVACRDGEQGLRLSGRRNEEKEQARGACQVGPALLEEEE